MMTHRPHHVKSAGNRPGGGSRLEVAGDLGVYLGGIPVRGKPSLAPGRPERASPGLQTEGDQPGNGLAAAGDDDLLPCLDALHETGEMRLRVVDVDGVGHAHKGGRREQVSRARRVVRSSIQFSMAGHRQTGPAASEATGCGKSWWRRRHDWMVLIGRRARLAISETPDSSLRSGASV